jgi:hypothetical protein
VNAQRRRIRPRRTGRQFSIGVGIEQEMPRRIDREGGTRESMCRVIIGTGSKPGGKNAKIGRTVAATAAAFVKRRNRAQQLWNG